jgi:hypothetical protein
MYLNIFLDAKARTRLPRISITERELITGDRPNLSMEYICRGRVEAPGPVTKT